MKKTRRPAARKAATKKSKPPTRRGRAMAKARPRRAAKPAAAVSGAGHLKRHYVTMFAKEVPVTVKLMKAYPAGQDAFRPHERSTPAALLAHTFSLGNALAGKAISGELTMPPDFPPAPASYADAVANYERGARELLEALEEMPESRLSETVDFFTGPGQIGPITVGELLWLMLLDSIHHRGQLSVYVRMAGGKVPSIYGPSADEPWM
jgi:uncharacterized damage-inducible protein DinB